MDKTEEVAAPQPEEPTSTEEPNDPEKMAEKLKEHNEEVKKKEEDIGEDEDIPELDQSEKDVSLSLDSLVGQGYRGEEAW